MFGIVFDISFKKINIFVSRRLMHIESKFLKLIDISSNNLSINKDRVHSSIKSNMIKIRFFLYYDFFKQNNLNFFYQSKVEMKRKSE